MGDYRQWSRPTGAHSGPAWGRTKTNWEKGTGNLPPPLPHSWRHRLTDWTLSDTERIHKDNKQVWTKALPFKYCAEHRGCKVYIIQSVTVIAIPHLHRQMPPCYFGAGDLWAAPARTPASQDPVRPPGPRHYSTRSSAATRAELVTAAHVVSEDRIKRNTQRAFIYCNRRTWQAENKLCKNHQTRTWALSQHLWREGRWLEKTLNTLW